MKPWRFQQVILWQGLAVKGINTNKMCTQGFDDNFTRHFL
jgi:hypothetical protein